MTDRIIIGLILAAGLALAIAGLVKIVRRVRNRRTQARRVQDLYPNRTERSERRKKHV